MSSGSTGASANHKPCGAIARISAFACAALCAQCMSQAMRAVVASDFCNASSALDFRHWTFLNADLNVNMAREPVGEWILLDAVSWIGPDGAGLAMARLADAKGYFGRCTQSLVIEKR